MKVINIACKLKCQISTMVTLCGSYMFELSISKDVEKRGGYNKGVDSREGSCTFMTSNTNCQRIEN